MYSLLQTSTWQSQRTKLTKLPTMLPTNSMPLSLSSDVCFWSKICWIPSNSAFLYGFWHTSEVGLTPWLWWTRATHDVSFLSPTCFTLLLAVKFDVSLKSSGLPRTEARGCEKSLMYCLDKGQMYAFTCGKDSVMEGHCGKWP